MYKKTKIDLHLINNYYLSLLCSIFNSKILRGYFEKKIEEKNMKIPER